MGQEMSLDAGHDAGDTDRALLDRTSVFPNPDILRIIKCITTFELTRRFVEKSFM